MGGKGVTSSLRDELERDRQGAYRLASPDQPQRALAPSLVLNVLASAMPNCQ